MRRMLPLLLLLALAVAPGDVALADGCPLPCSGPSVSPPDAKLLFAQPDGEAGRLLAYDTATRDLRFALPPGRASADGHTFVAGRTWPRRTLIERFATANGGVLRRDVVRGEWSLASVSPTGAFVALSRRAGVDTQVLLLDALSRPLRRLRLRGNVEVETVSKDGRRLFLIEHLRARRYRVRTLDLGVGERALRRHGALAPMTGYARTAVGSNDGRWLLTLYVDTKRRSAFVHALDLVHARPLCIAVPSRGRPTALDRYSLKLSPDARTLFAANPALGVVSEIDLTRLRVARTVRFAPRTRKAPPRPSGATATVSRDGRTLYFTSGRDLWAYDRRRRSVRGPYATWGRVVALGFGVGDRRIHVLRGDGRVVAFNAATGRLIRRR